MIVPLEIWIVKLTDFIKQLSRGPCIQSCMDNACACERSMYHMCVMNTYKSDAVTSTSETSIFWKSCVFFWLLCSTMYFYMTEVIRNKIPVEKKHAARHWVWCFRWQQSAQTPWSHKLPVRRKIPVACSPLAMTPLSLVPFSPACVGVNCLTPVPRKDSRTVRHRAGFFMTIINDCHYATFCCWLRVSFFCTVNSLPSYAPIACLPCLLVTARGHVQGVTFIPQVWASACCEVPIETESPNDSFLRTSPHH
jgi:hypothetical protein